MQLDAAESNAMSRIGAALEDLDPDRQSRVMFALANTATPPWLDPDDTLGPTREQQIRIAALTFAASITQHADGMSFRDIEQTSIGMADRAAGWIATGTYDWTTPDPTGVEFGPGVACACGPDSVAHTHDAPWGCTTCSCRFYVAFGDAEESTNDAERPEDAAHHFAAELVRLNTELARRGYQPSPGTPLDTAPVDTALAAVDRLTRDVNTLRLDVADLMPEDAVETPEQSTAIVDGNLAAMSLTVEAGDRGAPCGCRAYDPNHNHHTTAEHTNCGPGLPCGGCDSCISGQAYHGDRLAKEAGGA